MSAVRKEDTHFICGKHHSLLFGPEKLKGPYHRLQTGSRDHELHLLSEHSGRRLLMDEIVAAVNLQLGFQVWRRMEILAVFSWASALHLQSTSKRLANNKTIIIIITAICLCLLSDKRFDFSLEHLIKKRGHKPFENSIDYFYPGF